MSKWFLASKTVWGGLIAVVPGLLPLVGVDLPAVEIQAFGDAVNSWLTGTNEVVGAGLILWGRWTATKSITLKVPS